MVFMVMTVRVFGVVYLEVVGVLDIVIPGDKLMIVRVMVVMVVVVMMMIMMMVIRMATV